MHNRGDDGISLWDEEDGFFYDVLHLFDHSRHPIKLRSMVRLISSSRSPDPGAGRPRALPAFRAPEWFIENRPDPTRHGQCMRTAWRARAACCRWCPRTACGGCCR
ncbi:MAG: hypothetical protein R2712_28965 [Vicinamibacterales bacterium]